MLTCAGVDYHCVECIWFVRTRISVCKHACVGVYMYSLSCPALVSLPKYVFPGTSGITVHKVSLHVLHMYCNWCVPNWSCHS